MEPQVSISDLPLSMWSRILSILIHDGYSYSLNIRTLKQLYRCKIASKKLNQLLDDEYWLVVVRSFKSKYSRKYFMQRRLEYIVKINDAAKLDQCKAKCQIQTRLVLILQSVRALVFKHKQEPGFYDRLISLFPLAIQYADLQLLRFFNRLPLARFPPKVLCKSIQIAYQKEAVDKLEFVLSFFPKNSVPSIVFILEALKSGKRLDFSTPHKMIELLLIPFDEATRTEKINQLFGESKAPKQAVIIPEGELPNFEKLSHKQAFLRDDTNFTIQSKKGNNSDLMSLLYREKNGTMHEIDIATKTDQSDDNKTITYCYEGVETTNINELLLRTSLAERMFSSYPHQLIAVTKQLAALPYEQQPWFKGILTEPARLTLASNAPNNTTFFTYSSENEVWLSFTATPGSQKQPHKIKMHDGKGILDYVTKEKFWLGLHNGGEIFGLAEHLVRRAVHNGDFNLVKQLIAEHNLDLKTNAYFDKPDNMLSSYLKLQKKETVNNDMVKWFIENGAPLEKGHFSAVVKVCNDDVIKMIAETGYYIDMISIQALMQRGCRYDTLTACWNTYLNTDQTPCSLDSYFFVALEQNKFKKTTYNIRTLIMMAWKYDEHCLLRQLPKEIVLEILSYDYIDEPPYWDVLHMLIEYPKFTERFFQSARNEDFATVFPLVWKNWDLKSYQPVKLNICKVMLNSRTYPVNPSKVDANVPLFLKFLQRLTDPAKKFEINSVTKLTKYCLLKESPITLELFKELLEKNITYAKPLQSIQAIRWDCYMNYVYMPPIFLPFITENKPMIELLVDRELFVNRVTQAQTEYTLEKFLAQYHPSKLHLLQFVEEYKAKRHIDNK